MLTWRNRKGEESDKGCLKKIIHTSKMKITAVYNIKLLCFYFRCIKHDKILLLEPKLNADTSIHIHMERMVKLANPLIE